MKLTQLFNTVTGLLLLLYPVLVYCGLNLFEPKFIALFLIAILLLRILSNRSLPFSKQSLLSITLTGTFLSGIILACIFVCSHQLLALKFYPVMVNVSLLLVFSYTLIYPPSMIERIARLTKPDLSVTVVNYTKQVTQIWCLFFLLNGLFAAYTVFISLHWWTLYNGLIAYILMGILFTGEFLFRQRIIVKKV